LTLLLCCRKQYPTILGCIADTMQTLDDSIAAAGGAADFDIEHHVLIATNKLIARGFLKLPEDFIDPEQQARDVSFIMATASRFICEPWRWVGHLYLPFLTAVSTFTVAICTVAASALCTCRCVWHLSQGLAFSAVVIIVAAMFFLLWL
jgi:hypothetical protein